MSDDDKKQDGQEEVTPEEAITDEILEEAVNVIFLAGERGFDAIFSVLLTWAQRQFELAEGTEDEKLLAVYEFFNNMNNDLKDSFTRGFENVAARIKGEEGKTPLIFMPSGKILKH